MPHFTYIGSRASVSRGARPPVLYTPPKPPTYVAEGGPTTYGSLDDTSLWQPQIRSYPSYLGGINMAQPYGNTVDAIFRSEATDWKAKANSTHQAENAVFTYLPENDLYDIPNSDAFDVNMNRIASYLDDRKAVGFTVVLITALPKDENAWPQAGVYRDYYRLLQNNLFMTWVGTHCDSVCDFGGLEAFYNTSNTVMYAPLANNTTANATYSPGIYPTEYAHTILADVLRTHLKAVHHFNL